MPLNDKPLIVLTNDDGVHSPGLAAAVTALEQLGEVLVVAPLVQQSGTGRSMPNYTSGAITAQGISVAGSHHAGYAVDGTPAQCVQRALLVLAQRPVALVVAGINYGENVGSGITISGTVGAALEAASMGVPALAISLETAVDQHHSHSAAVDFTVAAHFTRVMARLILDAPRTHDVDVLKVDVPIAATIASAWRITRVSRLRYYIPHAVQSYVLGEPLRLPYGHDTADAEPDSDAHAIAVSGLVSVTPLSLDMTARVDLSDYEARLRNIAR